MALHQQNTAKKFFPCAILLASYEPLGRLKYLRTLANARPLENLAILQSLETVIWHWRKETPSRRNQPQNSTKGNLKRLKQTLQSHARHSELVDEIVLPLCSLCFFVCLFPHQTQFWRWESNAYRSRNLSPCLELLNVQPGNCMYVFTFVCCLEESTEIMRKGYSHHARIGSQVSRPDQFVQNWLMAGGKRHFEDH